MRARFYDESLNNMLGICKKILDQLGYTCNCRVEMPEEILVINGNKDDKKIILLVKQAGKGFVKVTVEMEMPVRTIQDYEKKKRSEVALLNSIDAFLHPVAEVELGI